MGHATAGGSWNEVRFGDRFVSALPADPNRSNRRRQVLEAVYSHVDPTAVSGPKMVAYSRDVAQMFGFGDDMMQSQTAAEVFGGNRLLSGMRPYSVVYGGHQFGNWAGQLGDGRAITLGELRADDGQRYEFQLKGAGPTPYSRTADGRAVLRSSVREFLMSEAMHHLGVPTTRALSLVSTGDAVIRDMFYDGHPKEEPGAIVCRVAPSFLRFGNFEIFAARADHDRLKTLADFAITEFFPELGAPGPDVYAAWLSEIARRTAEMITHWMRVGFVHGVMNTDNMSVLGLTIDYGPYGWIDHYDPGWTPNTTDAHGRRYRFGHQPRVAFWNLARFAEAIFPLIGDESATTDALEAYPRHLEVAQREMYLAKLGLGAFHDGDLDLIEDLLAWMTEAEVDMTIFFRQLAEIRPAPEGAASGVASAGEQHVRSSDGERESPSPHSMSPNVTPLMDAYYREPEPAHLSMLRDWVERYQARLQLDPLSPNARSERMRRTNPKYVLRNYMAQLAIDQAEQGEPTLVRSLWEMLRRPYDEQPDHETYFARRPEWARNRPGCSTLSCSS